MTTVVSDVLGRAEGLIRELNENLSADELDPDKWGLWFSSADEGSLFLTPDEARHYERTVDALHAAVEVPDQVSRRTIESWLQNAIFVGLDLQNQRRTHPDTGVAISFDERLANAIAQLRSLLTTRPHAWQVWHPIEGLTASDLPLKFGPIEFLALNDSSWQSLIEMVHGHIDDNTAHTPQQKIAIKQRYEDQWLAELKGANVAKCVVYAHDSASALDECRRVVRVVLDVLNFVAGDNRYNRNLRAQAYFPESARRHVTTSMEFAEHVLLSAPRSVRGPMRAVELVDVSNSLILRASEVLSLAVNSYERLPSKSEITRLSRSFGWLLTTAMSWAGRAEVTQRPDEALLYFIIALESMMLHPDEKSEAAYKLAIRVACLLELDPQRRRKVHKRINDLYNVRSNVVHNGDYRVLSSDVGISRNFVRHCIYKLLLDERCSAIDTADALKCFLDDIVFETVSESVDVGVP